MKLQDEIRCFENDKSRMVSSSGLFKDQIGQDIEYKRSQTMKRMIGSLIVLESEYYVLTAAITNLRLIQCTFCCVRFSVYLFLFWRVNVIHVTVLTKQTSISVQSALRLQEAVDGWDAQGVEVEVKKRRNDDSLFAVT